MSGPAGDFRLPRLERVVSGANVVDTLARDLAREGVARIVVVTGRTLAASPLLQRITAPLGDRCIAVFREAKQHVPSCSAAELARLLEHERADCAISVGGGSPIDTVKAAIHLMLTASAGDSSAGVSPAHIAVPTTLSAGEFTSVAGVTDEQTRIKRAIHEPRITPRAVYVDPTVTLETPPWLWAASGVRAIDHAVETMYSVRHHPFSDALASRGLAALVDHLPPSLSTTGAAQLDHRLHCQIGAWMAVFGITNAGFGLSHVLGHQIGPRWDVAHGITSCITLPHVMRFMAHRAPDRFRSIAGALGIPYDDTAPLRAARACADRVESFISQFGLARRLRDVGVSSGEIGGVADVVYEVIGDSDASLAVTRDEIHSMLRAAF